MVYKILLVKYQFQARFLLFMVKKYKCKKFFLLLRVAISFDSLFKMLNYQGEQTKPLV